MENTYTYTTRDATQPERVATFTLNEQDVIVEPVVINQIGQALPGLDGGDAFSFGRRTWFPPLFLWMLRQLGRILSLNDVQARVRGDALSVVTWPRLAGLRLVPVWLAWREVDNPDASTAFAAELQKRQERDAGQSGLWGPFDYWMTWIMALVGVTSLVSFIRGRRRDRELNESGIIS